MASFVCHHPLAGGRLEPQPDLLSCLRSSYPVEALPYTVICPIFGPPAANVLAPDTPSPVPRSELAGLAAAWRTAVPGSTPDRFPAASARFGSDTAPAGSSSPAAGAPAKWSHRRWCPDRPSCRSGRCTAPLWRSPSGSADGSRSSESPSRSTTKRTPAANRPRWPRGRRYPPQPLRQPPALKHPAQGCLNHCHPNLGP